jgi:hypothetical protein
MRPSWIVHVAALSQLVPPLVGSAAGRLGPPARRWTVIWCLLLMASDALSYGVAGLGHNNLWVSYLFMPLEGAAMLWALSYWHAPGTGRLTLRLAVPLFVLLSAVLTIAVEDPRAQSLVVAPFRGLVLLLAALWTFLRRGLGGHERLMQQDWFWVVGGFMLVSGTSTPFQPIIWYFVNTGQLATVNAVFDLKAVADIAAFAAIARGVMCPLPYAFSGGGSSPPFSPLGSSSAPSASRW